MEPLETPGLQADTDPVFVQRSATVGRVARVGLVVVVGLAALGVFGGAGPLVKANRAGPNGFAVRYDRFARLDAPLSVEVRLPPGDSAVTFTGDLADGLQLEAVVPAPRAEAARPAGHRFAVDVAAGRSVTMQARPLRFGRLRGGVQLDGGDRIDVRITVYP